MSRQSTDNLYIELGYFTPENYYVYGAEARLDAGFYIEPGYIDVDYYADQGAFATLTCELTEVEGTLQEANASISSSATVGAVVGVIKQQSAALSAEFACTGTISHIEGADLFAFSEAALALAVSRLRDYSASLDSIFDIATDYIRIKQLSADADSEFTQSAEGARSRDFDIEIQAAVSLGVDSNSIKVSAADINIAAALTADPNVIYNISANFEVLGVLSLSADAIRNSSASLNTAATLSADVTKIKNTAASINSAATVAVAAQVPNRRPRPYTLINTPTLSTTNKFGGKSAFTGNTNELTLFDSPDWKTWKTVDLWYRPNGGTTGRYHYIYKQDSGNADNVVYIGVAKTAAADTYFVQIRVRTGGINYTYTSSNIVWTAAFRHLRITRDSNGINLWIDGVKNTPTSNDSLTTLPNINNGVSIGFPGGNGWSSSTSGLNTGFIDELWVTKDLLNSYTDSTITVPTTANQLTTAQQANTILLSHYDTDFSDDTGAWFEASATLLSQTTLVADTRKSTDIVSTPPSVFALAVSADIILSADAALNSPASLTANVSNIKQLAAELASEGAFVLLVDYLVVQDAYLASEFTLTAGVDKLKIVTATIDASTSLTASLDVAIYGGVANITAAASLTFDNNVKVIPAINWLPRRSVWHFDNPYSDVISTVGVSTSGLVIIDTSPAQTGFGTSVGTSSESSAGQAWFTGNRTATVKRTTGKYNTNIGTNDFAFDFYLRPYGDTEGTHTVVDFYESDIGVKFSYTYDRDFTVDANDYERFNFTLSDNTNTYTYNYVTATNSSPNFDTYYTRVGDDWLYFRIQRVNDVLTVKMRDIRLVPGTTDIITVEDYNNDFGSAYRIFEASGNTVPTRIDLINLQIDSAEYPLQVANAQPNIQEWYTAWISAGATIETSSNLTADALIILFGEAEISSAATLTQGNFRLRFADSAMLSTLTQTVQAQTVLSAAADITSVATLSCDAVKTARPNAQLLINASVVTLNTRVRFADTNITANSVLSLPFGQILKTPNAVPMVAEFQQTAVNVRTRDNLIVTESIATNLAAVTKIGDFLITLESNFEQTAIAVKTVDRPVALNCAATLNAFAFNITDIVETLSSETTLTTTVDKIRSIGAEFEVSFSQDTNAVKTTSAISNNNSEFSVATTAKRIRFGTAGLNTATTLNAVAEIIVNANVELDSAFTGLFVFDKIVRIQANLSSQGFILSAGRVIHIDEYYTIIVPQEYRRIKILAESRTIQVDEETRVELI